MDTFLAFMLGVLLVCLAYLLNLLVQVLQLPEVFQFTSFGLGVAGSLILAVTGAISAAKLVSSRVRAKPREQKPLRETLLYGVTGYRAAEEPIWRTKPMKMGSGLPHTIHMMCPSCSRPIHMDSRFCEFCGFKFHKGLDIGFRLQSMMPALATCDNVSEDLQQVYRDDGKPFGIAAGRADPFGDVLKITGPDGTTYECEVDRLLLIQFSSVPGQFKGSLIMMPEWFIGANEALALAQTVKSTVAGLLEDLRDKKISEDEFEKALPMVSSKLLTGPGIKGISKLEKSLQEQRARLTTVLGSVKDKDETVVLGFEVRTVDSLLDQIRSSRESLRRAVTQIQEGVFPEKIKSLVSVIPTF